MLWFAGPRVPVASLSSATAASLRHAAAALHREVAAGPRGVLALAGAALTVLAPLTQCRARYGIGVGYGLSVAAMAALLYGVFALDLTTPAGWLVAALGFYGLRLATYLLLRDARGWRPSAAQDKGFMPRPRRVVLSVALALFYAMMTTPALYVARRASTASGWPTVAGTVAAWITAITEAWADGHKHVVKSAARSAGARPTTAASTFRGPTTGLYRLSRHPNYASEVLFWAGVFLAGAPVLPPVMLALSALGLAGIAAIIRHSTAQLEQRQREAYGRQRAYQEWIRRVPYSLFPFVKGGQGSSPAPVHD